jgi:hypothetical protein
MFPALIKLLFGLVPDEHATPAEHRQWRKTVGMTLAGMIPLLLVLGLGLMAVFGAFPKYVDGFARSSDVQAVSQQFSSQIGVVSTQLAAASSEMKRQYVNRLSESLLDTRSKECHAKTEEGRQLYTANIQRMMNEYQRLTDQNYSVPACGDL